MVYSRGEAREEWEREEKDEGGKKNQSCVPRIRAVSSERSPNAVNDAVQQPAAVSMSLKGLRV